MKPILTLSFTTLSDWLAYFSLLIGYDTTRLSFAINSALPRYNGGIEKQKFLLKDQRVSVHMKKVKKNPNDRMLDKSGEFFLKPCVFKGLYHSSHWWVLLRSWSVPGEFWLVPDGFWSVLLGSRFSIRARWV